MSTKKKSQANIEDAWVCGHSVQVGPLRIGEGSMLYRCRMPRCWREPGRHPVGAEYPSGSLHKPICMDETVEILRAPQLHLVDPHGPFRVHDRSREESQVDDLDDIPGAHRIRSRANGDPSARSVIVTVGVRRAVSG